MSKCLILSKNTYEAKLALLEDNKLEEIYIEREKEKEISGNIYKGKIVDILNKGEIIFVDIGLEKNAFLSFENKKNIPEFNISDSLIVQVETEARDEKGARLTLDYSINGENLVLLPNSKNLSISKKIEDLEIVKKLKDTFLNIDKGLILRTKSVEKPPETLLEEYKKLEAIDNQIKKDFKEKNSVLLYDNNSILKKALTLLDENIDEFIIDDEDSFNKIKNTLLDDLKSVLSDNSFLCIFIMALFMHLLASIAYTEHAKYTFQQNLSKHDMVEVGYRAIQKENESEILIPYTVDSDIYFQDNNGDILNIDKIKLDSSIDVKNNYIALEIASNQNN